MWVEAEEAVEEEQGQNARPEGLEASAPGGQVEKPKPVCRQAGQKLALEAGS